jgi:peptide/nickel transport system substrate-binding protein
MNWNFIPTPNLTLKTNFIGITVALVFGCLPLAVAGSSDTLVIQNGGDLADTLDPHQAFSEANLILENTYETLYELTDSSGGLGPLLATEHTISEDGLTYTFTLREGVTFHSGNPMTCADAEYSFRRYLVVNNFSSPAFIVSDIVLGFENWDDDLIANTPYSVISDAVHCNEAGQLVINLVRPDAPALLKLSAGVSIVDSQFAIEGGEWSGTEEDWQEWVGQEVFDSLFNEEMSGTGAYRVVSREADQIVAQAFDGYWGGVPAIQNVIIQRVPSQDNRVLALKNGDADIVSVSDRQTLELFENVEGVVVTDDLAPVTARVIYLNQNITPNERIGSGQLDGAGIPPDFFADVNVRRAFAHAFDYGRYMVEVQGGKAVIVNMALPPTFLGYDESLEPLEFDLAKAEEEFKQAWDGQVWEKGFTFVASVRADNSDFLAALEILKENVEALNPKFNLDIQQEATSTLYPAADEGEVAMVIDFTSLEYPDPDSILTNVYASDGLDSTWTGFASPDVDAHLEQGRLELDPEKREVIYGELARVLQDLAPVILMPIETRHRVSRQALQGYRENINLVTASDVLWKKLSKE